MAHCLYVKWFVDSVCGVAVCSVSLVFYKKKNAHKLNLAEDSLLSSFQCYLSF